MPSSDPDSSSTAQEQVELRLLTDFEPLIKAVAVNLKVRPQDYKDALQAGYAGVLEAYRKFDTTRGVRFGAFAYPYVIGSIRRAIYGGRQPNTDAPTIDLDAAPTEYLVVPAAQDDTVFSGERRRAVRKFVVGLPTLERRAVIDGVWKEQPQAVTAAAGGVSQPAVHKALKRALAKGADALGAFRPAA